MRIVGADGRPTAEFTGFINRVIDQLGGQGRDYVGETKIQSGNIVTGAQPIIVNDVTVGNVAAAMDAINANVSLAQESAAAVAGGSTSTLGGSIVPAFAVGAASKQVVFTATGGTPPYVTYAWTRVSGASDAALEIDDTAIPNPTFSTTLETEQNAVWKVTVTDTNGDTFPTNCSISLLGAPPS